MKKIYIAGKVSGLPFKETAVKFANAHNAIKDLGFEPLNPIEITQDLIIENTELLTVSGDALWKSAMRLCIKKLMDCDAVVLLPDWYDSQGARIEKILAEDLGIPTFNFTAYGLNSLKTLGD